VRHLAVARRLACRVERVDLTVDQHLRERFRRTDRFELDVRRQVERDFFRPAGFFFTAGEVLHRVDRHAVLVGENARIQAGAVI